ncbi:MAG: acyl-CoA dehydrogenase family protein, partial [Acidimicrobiales bacterium]
MDFGLSEELALLRETADRFVSDVCPPELAKEWDDGHHYPAELFRGFADLGWFELPFPVDEGGGGGGAIELAIISEALGRASL